MSLMTRGILVLVIGTILGLGVSIGGGFIGERESGDTSKLSWEQARLFAEVMERVKQDYVEPIDDQTLLESAIRGMVADLDAHSQYLDAAEYQDVRISASGGYSGVGLEVSGEEGRILVVAPIDGTPAHRAGIRSGDTIVAIDDFSVHQHGLQETISKMRGHSGTRVSISVLRGRSRAMTVKSRTLRPLALAIARRFSDTGALRSMTPRA